MHIFLPNRDLHISYYVVINNVCNFFTCYSNVGTYDSLFLNLVLTVVIYYHVIIKNDNTLFKTFCIGARINRKYYSKFKKIRHKIIKIIINQISSHLIVIGKNTTVK